MDIDVHDQLKSIFPWLHKPTDCTMEWFIILLTTCFTGKKEIDTFTFEENKLMLELLVETEVYPSKSEVYRAIKAGALKLNNQLINKDSMLFDFELINVQESEYKLGVIKTGKTSHQILLYDTAPF